MTPETTAATILYVLLAILCIASNSLVCFLITKRKILYNVLRYYILSLAFTDLFVGIILIPLYIFILTNIVPKGSKFGTYKWIYTGLDVFLGVCSTVHLCLMSIDRALSITKPLLHRRYMQRKSFVVKLLILPWVISLVCAVPNFIQLNSPNYTVVITVLTFVLPTFLIIICYVCIFVAIRRRNITNSSRQINERKLISTVLCIIIVFIACWGPFHVFNILYSLDLLQFSSGQIDTALNVFKWMQYLNSASNPFIYAIFHPNFRSAITAISSKCFRCKQVVPERNSSQ